MNTSGARQTPATSRYYFPALFGAVLLLSLPLVSLRYLPFVDYPNHLARCFLLFHYHDVPRLQNIYQVLYQPIPNVACDVVIVALQHLFNVLVAGRIFMVLLVMLYALGCHLLAKTLQGHASWIALPCLFSVYNSMLMWGFINYVLGIALFLISLAYWLRWRERWTAARYMGAVLLVLACYLTHLGAYAFLGVVCATVCILDFAGRRRNLLQAAQDLGVLVPPLLAFALFMHGSGTVGQIVWASLRDKVDGVFAFVRTYNAAFDVLFIAVIFSVVAIALLRASKVRPAWPLTIAAIILIGCFLACPLVLFTSSGADSRFIPPAILLLVLAVRVELRKAVSAFLLGTVMLACVVRVGVLWYEWRGLDQAIEQAMALADALPHGARVYPAWFTNGCEVIPRSQAARQRPHIAALLAAEMRADDCRRRDIVFQHVLHYATVNAWLYVPSLHAHRGQQPLVFRRLPRYIPPTLYDEAEWMQDARYYDFVWAYKLPAPIAQKLGEEAAPVGRSGPFELWKLNPSARLPAS